MIDVEEALARVLEQARPGTACQVPLTEALGCVLAEAITSDVDSPPHDKALVDGYALIAADVRDQQRELLVLEEVTAGEVPQQPVRPGTATRIMTGAPVPDEADAVVMIEQTELVAEDSGPARVRIGPQSLSPGANILRKSACLSRGEQVLDAGHLLRPAEIGLLAEIGRPHVSVYARPQVAVVATGNELVPPTEQPRTGQIRNSNGPMLAALVQRAGGRAVDLGIAADIAEVLEQRIALGLKSEVLLLSGGVSAGVLDLVPAVLARLGVQQVFHKVRVKPGKPLWFGLYTGRGGHRCLVFGLPGNPVSSLVCFELFVRPAIERLSGRPGTGLPRETACLTRAHQQRGDRATYFPARLISSADGLDQVEPLPWLGSADLRRLADADALAYFPPGDRHYAAGERVPILRMLD